ncbi:MAG: D-alanyl-D-alanine carboxypeptidase [Firmicutes bacterium]|nr:D-alanyl-D-alanine carboxypeptidase [Bacillota bacterium]
MERVLKRITTTILIVALLVVTMTAYAPKAFAASEPNIQGKAAIVYCATTGEVIWEKNSDKKYNPASMTKVLTCLIAIEKLDLDKVVEVTAEATNVIPTKIWLSEGEKVTVRDLLYASMLYSANDAAAALAIEVSGSIKDFAKLMNQRAKEIGCTKTNFVNPHGLQGEKHRTTAKDMALITAEAFKNPTLREIAGAKTYTIGDTNKSQARELKNGNLLLYGGKQELSSGIIEVKKYKGVFGGKTGTSENRVATMTAGLDYDGMEIYVVVMGSTPEKRFSDIRKLLNYGKENVSKYVAFEKGDGFDEKGKIKGGATNRVEGVAAEPGYINLPEGASASLVSSKPIYDEDLKAPIEKNQKIGIVEIYLADEKVREIDLLAKEAIEEGWFLSGLGITNFQTIIICVILGLALAFFAALLTLRAINMRRRKKRRQRKLMQEAQRQLERERSMKQRGWPY